MILITGGLGYIGSHIAVELLKLDYDVVIIDKVNNQQILTTIKTLSDKFVYYECCDLLNYEQLNKIFGWYNITNVIHLAASKSVPESLRYPLSYYENNVMATLNLLKCMKKYNVNNLIFSSTAAVYESSDKLLNENSSIKPLSPYGKSKWMVEQILVDMCKSDQNFNCTVLRYFNPVGNLKGLRFDGDNVIPCMVKAMRQNTFFTIYGHDYNTIDGTAVRDYICIFDVVDAHIKVLNLTSFNLYNIGTSKGTSVLQLVNLFNTYYNNKLNFVFGEKRLGDSQMCVCDASKIKKEIGWECKYDIMVDNWLDDELI